jgi:hypothetical protein
MLNGINKDSFSRRAFFWRKIRDYSGTLAQMVQLGLPERLLATLTSIFMELACSDAVRTMRHVCAKRGTWCFQSEPWN